MSPQKAFAHFFYVTLMALGQSEELVSRGAYPRYYQNWDRCGVHKTGPGLPRGVWWLHLLPISRANSNFSGQNTSNFRSATR